MIKISIYIHKFETETNDLVGHTLRLEHWKQWIKKTKGIKFWEYHTQLGERGLRIPYYTVTIIQPKNFLAYSIDYNLKDVPNTLHSQIKEFIESLAKKGKIKYGEVTFPDSSVY